TDNQGDARRLGSSLERVRVFAAKGDDGQVLSGGVLFQASESGTDVAPAAFQIGEHQHRFGLLRAIHELLGVRDDLNPVVQVLEAVDELAARQQLFVKH